MNSSGIKRKVLICPLNWGLGHATRDVPIIRKLIENDFEVMIGTDGDALTYLRLEFPDIRYIQFPGYKVKYSKSRSQVLRMLLLLPKIILWIIREKRILSRLIRDHHFDILISDNRFGVWDKSTYNVFITHQLRVVFPGIVKIFEPIYKWALSLILKRYDECWIPDFKGDRNLSGLLSHGNFRAHNLKYIGPLSRFSCNNDEKDNTTDILFILSGPEPQRSIFEKIIYKQIETLKGNFIIVRGTNKIREREFKCSVYDIVDSDTLYGLISNSNTIVCRSGYSSVMDLFKLKKKALLIPTPGQTEQEYLADYLKNKKLFYSVSQDQLNLLVDIAQVYSQPKIEIIEPQEIDLRIKYLKER